MARKTTTKKAEVTPTPDPAAELTAPGAEATPTPDPGPEATQEPQEQAEGVSIGEAVVALREGKKVKRLLYGDNGVEISLRGGVLVVPAGKTVREWTPATSDIMAGDWVIVE